MAEINKLKITEFKRENENLKIAHGNPAKRPRSDDLVYPSPSSHANLVKKLEPLFKKITNEITRNILETIKTNQIHTTRNQEIS